MRQRHLTAEITELNAQLPQLYQQVSVRAVITRTEHLLDLLDNLCSRTRIKNWEHSAKHT